MIISLLREEFLYVECKICSHKGIRICYLIKEYVCYGGWTMERENIGRSSFKHNFLKQVIIRLDFQGVLQAEMDKILIQVKPYSVSYTHLTLPTKLEV